MSTYETTLTAREAVAEGTMAFHFAKPAGFVFKPAQAIELILNGGGERMAHAFSLVCAPFERDLVVTTRMRDSAYKRTLKALPIGAAVHIDGPFGALTLHQDRARPAVFVAGGIGITPFVSMLRQATRDRLAQRLVLVYSNRRPEDSAFLAELQRLERENDHFRLVATMTEMAASKHQWHGETGFVDDSLLKRITGSLAAPIFYLVGPPAMVEAMRETLEGLGVVDTDIRSEAFYGY
jgi:ferredoxin-NADP reductase